MKQKHLTYQARAEQTKHPVTRRLLLTMEQKKTNLALSADVTSSDALLSLAEQIGPEICVLKTHIDIIEDFSPKLTAALSRLSEKHHFLIFEDRKFADIGNTVKHQYEGGIYRIADWAHIVNAHSLPGKGIIEGLHAVGLHQERGLLLLAEISSSGHLCNTAYTQATLNMAIEYPQFVMGFIAQHRLSENPDFLTLTPGVQFNQTQDPLGQRYLEPEHVILEKGSDIIIVGRGIYAAADPLKQAQQYRTVAWEAYQKRCALSL